MARHIAHRLMISLPVLLGVLLSLNSCCCRSCPRIRQRFPPARARPGPTSRRSASRWGSTTGYGCNSCSISGACCSSTSATRWCPPGRAAEEMWPQRICADRRADGRLPDLGGAARHAARHVVGALERGSLDRPLHMGLSAMVGSRAGVLGRVAAHHRFLGGAGWLPSTGRDGAGRRRWAAGSAHASILPAITLSLVSLGPVARMTRTSLLETLSAKTTCARRAPKVRRTGGSSSATRCATR